MADEGVAYRANALFENNHVDVCCSNESVILTRIVQSMNDVVSLPSVLRTLTFDRSEGDKIIPKFWEKFQLFARVTLQNVFQRERVKVKQLED